MYRVLDTITNKIVHEDDDYDTAVMVMRKFNEGKGKVFVARGWAKTEHGSIERELYSRGMIKEYGHYVLTLNDTDVIV